jgi:predicted RNA-binding Zn ribbon-like protein
LTTVRLSSVHGDTLEDKRIEHDDPQEPGARPPAPGGLRVIQQFINSLDIEAGTEELSSPKALSAWLHEHGLTPRRARLTTDDLTRARDFRELLRALVLAHNGFAIDHKMIRAFDRQLADVALVARLEVPGTLQIEGSSSGLDGALGRMVGIVYAEMHTGRWDRLKACARDVCRWAFYDQSRNRAGTWCSMAVCGARTKSGTYYRRRHPEPSVRSS